MSYHRFKNEDGEEYGSFEVFWNGASQPSQWISGEDEYAAGWYWWACSPGCLPDGDPSGPFVTEQAAIDDAHGEPDQGSMYELVREQQEEGGR